MTIILIGILTDDCVHQINWIESECYKLYDETSETLSRL